MASIDLRVPSPHVVDAGRVVSIGGRGIGAPDVAATAGTRNNRNVRVEDATSGLMCARRRQTVRRTVRGECADEALGRDRRPLLRSPLRVEGGGGPSRSPRTKGTAKNARPPWPRLPDGSLCGPVRAPGRCPPPFGDVTPSDGGDVMA